MINQPRLLVTCKKRTCVSKALRNQVLVSMATKNYCRYGNRMVSICAQYFTQYMSSCTEEWGVGNSKCNAKKHGLISVETKQFKITTKNGGKKHKAPNNQEMKNSNPKLFFCGIKIFLFHKNHDWLLTVA